MNRVTLKTSLRRWNSNKHLKKVREGATEMPEANVPGKGNSLCKGLEVESEWGRWVKKREAERQPALAEPWGPQQRLPFLPVKWGSKRDISLWRDYWDTIAFTCFPCRTQWGLVLYVVGKCNYNHSLIWEHFHILFPFCSYNHFLLPLSVSVVLLFLNIF